MKNKLTERHRRALRWAVGMAEQWRGSLTGDPDPNPLFVFDKEVALANEALKRLPRTRTKRKTKQ